MTEEINEVMETVENVSPILTMDKGWMPIIAFGAVCVGIGFAGQKVIGWIKNRVHKDDDDVIEAEVIES